MSDSPLLVLGGSPRSAHASEVNERVARATSRAQLERELKEHCNTEILSAAALYAGKEHNIAGEYLSLSTPEPHLAERIRAAEAIIFATPVYFGDRSSQIEKVLSQSECRRALQEKYVACLSVGAKRNGGQETANLFLLYDLLACGARAVGNGPPHSQFGGTAVGGDPEAVLKDTWGLDTAYQTGERIAQLIQPQMISHNSKIPQILCLVLEDPADIRMTQALLRHSSKEICIEVCSLRSHPFQECTACSICPIPEIRSEEKQYACILQDSHDSMAELRKKISQSDALLIAVSEHLGAQLLWQQFIERTRFIRRNDFEWTNLPVGLWYAPTGQGAPLFPLRWVAHLLRHNSLVTPPQIASADRLPPDLITSLNKEVHRRRQRRAIRVQYLAGGSGGYQDTRLDGTEAWR